MPHVIYLHSALTQGRVPPRDDAERKRLLRFQRIDVSLAMGIAGLVNMSMLVIAAALFHDRGLLGLDSIEEAHAQFTALAGGGAALAFAVALLASGLASSSVGTYAGQVVMQGFIAPHDPDRPAPADHDDAGADRARHRPEPVALAGHLAGRAELRDPVRARAAGAPHAPQGHHGRARQPPADDRRGSVVAALIIALNLFLIVDTIFG